MRELGSVRYGWGGVGDKSAVVRGSGRLSSDYGEDSYFLDLVEQRFNLKVVGTDRTGGATE